VNSDAFAGRSILDLEAERARIEYQLEQSGAPEVSVLAGQRLDLAAYTDRARRPVLAETPYGPWA